MEVIAATSAITSLVSFGLQVAQGLFQLYTTIKNASTDLQGIYQDTRALCGVLAHLQEQLGEHSIPGSNKRFSANLKVLMPALDHCQTLFNELQGKVEAANGLLRNGESATTSEKLKPSLFVKDRFRPIWERAKWPFTRDDFAKIRSRLEDAKSTLNLCLVIILVTPQLKSDVGKEHELERKKAAVAVVEAFKKQQKAKQQAAIAANIEPSQVDESITSQFTSLHSTSPFNTMSGNLDHDRGNVGRDSHNDVERVKTDNSTGRQEKRLPYVETDELHAWISTASQSGQDNVDLIPVATRVRLPQREIQNILRDNRVSLLQALGQLNDKQRNWVISQANELGATLVHVSRWTTAPMETVFGNINVTSLFWITESANREFLMSPQPSQVIDAYEINSAVKLSRSGRPPFFAAVRRRFTKKAEPPLEPLHPGVLTSEPEPEPEAEPPLKFAPTPASEPDPELEFSLRRGRKTWAKRGVAIPTNYSQTEAIIDQSDKDGKDDTSHEEESLVEKLLAEWINVYDEPSPNLDSGKNDE